jgi:hypothetical protein
LSRKRRPIRRVPDWKTTLLVNQMEERLTPNTYTVNVFDDPTFTYFDPTTGVMQDGNESGYVSLRSAIEASNNSGASGNIINFSQAGTVGLSQGELFVKNSVEIDGDGSNPNAVPNFGTTVRGSPANPFFYSGGVDSRVFDIDGATGVAGPTPDANNHLAGWSLINTGNLDWSATADDPLTVNLETLVNPSTPGTDVAGAMDHFDPTQSYSWKAFQWTGTYTGPTTDTALNASTVFDTSAFQNSFNGTFAWHLDLSSGTIYLTYTPAP